ncbi:hypothetical protein GCM10009557_65300 [Virgisporangium ochraceum]|uniref:Uncharacterized protein n=1 Tax=Virgisporangium ochraceum TaxID=65505 RepID=A0A8J3ZRT0_9ACTN|nr:hypothetical protein [Virgisporangium ochraceum]GIJ67852.1 hypothetical protein Voc01_027690 [Virgisporangium ochraceum]
MNTITFRPYLLAVEWGPGEWPVLDIAIDGVPLLDRVRELELPYARAEELERADEFTDYPPGTLTAELAGNYMPLTSTYGWPSRHLLGEPTDLPHGADEGETMLLQCTCGIPDCWALLAKVAVTRHVVTWSGFRNSNRGWDLGALGPFEFSRSQYERALRTGPRRRRGRRSTEPGAG